jgi:glycosyltransferase involved in cell wall biosynthesis
MDKFAVLIPIHNEEYEAVNLGLQLEALELSYLFVDDGSTDRTMTNLWMKEIPVLCYFPKRGQDFDINLGIKTLLNTGYEWVLILGKKNRSEDIKKLDSALFWHEEESRILVTKSGNKLIHRDILNQINGKFFNLDLKLKIYFKKWKVIKVA